VPPLFFDPTLPLDVRQELHRDPLIGIADPLQGHLRLLAAIGAADAPANGWAGPLRLAKPLFSENTAEQSQSNCKKEFR
jgi:hypothetical protein